MSTRHPRTGWLAAHLFALLVCCLLLFSPGSNASAAGSNHDGSGGHGVVPFGPQFAVADFDGDQKADLASVRTGTSGQRNVLYLIDFRLSSGTRSTVGVTASAGGLQLASRDVNGDHFLDVVVTSLLTGEPIAVLLNDGRGNFTRSEAAAFPAAFRNSDSCFTSETSSVTDRTGAVPSRPPSGGEAMRCFPSQRNFVGSIAASTSPMAASSGRGTRRGRAPPSPPSR